MKKIGNVVSTLVLILAVLLAGIFFLPRLFGITPMAVLSGSMEPTYHVGGLVFAKEVDPETIEVGDPITFQLGTSDSVVTHRVIEVNKETKTFKTQGDANNIADGGEVAYSAVKGKTFDFSIPYIGYIAVYLGTTQGMIIVGMVVLVVILLSFLPDLFKKDNEKKGGKNS